MKKNNLNWATRFLLGDNEIVEKKEEEHLILYNIKQRNEKGNIIIVVSKTVESTFENEYPPVFIGLIIWFPFRGIYGIDGYDIMGDELSKRRNILEYVEKYIDSLTEKRKNENNLARSEYGKF